MPTAGAGVSVETGWRVGVTENMDDRAAQAVGTSALLNKAATRSASVAGGWICIGWAAWWGDFLGGDGPQADDPAAL